MSYNNTNAHMAQGNLDVLVFNIQGLPVTEHMHALTYFNFLISLLLILKGELRYFWTGAIFWNVFYMFIFKSSVIVPAEHFRKEPEHDCKGCGV